MSIEKQHDYSKVPPQLLPHVFKPGVSGNPAGRPPGRSLKEFSRAYLAGMTDEERLEFLKGIDKKVIWEMGEGKAEAKTDITTGGEKIQPVLVKFIGDEPTAN
jgi:hypothetical protein